MPSRNKTFHPYILLLFILAAAYLPLCTFYFGMKNDAFSDNFPNKFFISQALASRHLPVWNAYMNFGFPVYADMGFAFFNPITWLFALLGYNAYTLTLEVLLYIYLGGIFMYRLGRYLKFEPSIAVTVAAMYICSGFFAGCLEYINFLTAAAFLPLVIQGLLQLFEGPRFKSSFILAIAIYFVFAGGHPAIPIVLLYFIFILVVLLFVIFKNYRNNAKKITIFLLLSFALFAVFYLPAIYSYITVLPYYARNNGAVQASYTNAGFTFTSWLSFIFPFATAVNQHMFGTDASMRNGFFSIAGFICVICCIKKATPLVKVLLVTAGIMLLLSLGGGIKVFIYNNLPLLKYIRYNGEFRVFAIVCFSIIAGFGLQRLAAEAKYARLAAYIFKVVLAFGIGVLIVAGITGYGSILATLHKIAVPAGVTDRIKTFLQQGSFTLFMCISALLAVIICLLSIRTLKTGNYNRLLVIAVVDVCLNSLLYLPVTGVGQKTLGSIQAVYNTSPANIPIPPLVPVNTIDTLDPVTTGLVGDITYYNKKIGTARLTDYPSYFSSTDKFFSNTAAVNEVIKHPYLFVKNNTAAQVMVEAFHPQRTTLVVANAHQGDTLVFLQNNYRFWHAAVDGKLVSPATIYTTFIGVPLHAGQNFVEFYYDDRWLFGCLVISLLSFLACLVISYRSSPTYK